MKTSYRNHGVLSTIGVFLFAGMLTSSTYGGVLTVGPDYRKPTNSLPAAYKNEQGGTWKEGKPLDNLPKGNWWTIFGDLQLGELEKKALTSNQNLRAAVARVDQSRATARVARGAFMPNVDLNPGFARQKYSPNQIPGFGNLTANTFSAPLDLSYEVDLWGRVRRGFESARDEAQASQAAFNTILLTLQADIAENYFTLRALDTEIATVNGTINLRHEQVKLVRLRYTKGLGNNVEVAQAETELAVAEAEIAALEQNRDELENAIAILVGENPSGFKLPAIESANWKLKLAEVPVGLPSDLLERRPDVAEAERQLASANAKIGIAKAAFFPVLTLTGSGGFLSADVDTLFNWNSRTWSTGPSLSLPIFAGGRNRANYKRAQAAFDESIARYRERVLIAFGDVENSLQAIRHLEVQSKAQERAVASSRQAANLADDRYRSGVTSYLEVVDANREALTAERGNTQLAGKRLVASVQLIKALGGGWNERLLYAGR